jgi:hypothetical protein
LPADASMLEGLARAMAILEFQYRSKIAAPR